MTFTREDLRDKIRSQLIYEIKNPKIWYSKGNKPTLGLSKKEVKK